MQFNIQTELAEIAQATSRAAEHHVSSARTGGLATGTNSQAAFHASQMANNASLLTECLANFNAAFQQHPEFQATSSHEMSF